MVQATHFDTLNYANKLKEGGVPPQQAETQAETLAGVFQENIATKQDIVDLRAVTKQDIADLRNDMDIKFSDLKNDVDIKFAAVDVKFALVDSKFAELKAEMIKWGVGISITQAALIVSLVKLLH